MVVNSINTIFIYFSVCCLFLFLLNIYYKHKKVCSPMKRRTEKRGIECKASNLPGFLFIRRAKLHRRFVLMRNWEEWGWGGALKCHNLFVFPCRGCVSFYPILPFIMKCRRFSLYFPYFEYKSWCNLG